MKFSRRSRALICPGARNFLANLRNSAATRPLLRNLRPKEHVRLGHGATIDKIPPLPAAPVASLPAVHFPPPRFRKTFLKIRDAADRRPAATIITRLASFVALRAFIIACQLSRLINQTRTAPVIRDTSEQWCSSFFSNL